MFLKRQGIEVLLTSTLGDQSSACSSVAGPSGQSAGVWAARALWSRSFARRCSTEGLRHEPASGWLGADRPIGDWIRAHVEVPVRRAAGYCLAYILAIAFYAGLLCGAARAMLQIFRGLHVE